MAKQFSVIIPIFNEERALKEVFKTLEQALRNCSTFEIIAIDDCSSDNSYDVLKRLKTKNLRVLHHEYNQGYGASLKTGIRASKYDTIVICDSDGTYPVDAIPKIVDDMRTYDMVVGARIGKEAKIPLIRRPAKAVLNMFASFMAARHIPDLNSGLRAFKKEIVIKYWDLFPQRFSFTSTLTMCCLTNGYRVKFAPIRYFKRTGSSSIHPIKDTIRFFQLVTKLALFFNPMRIFMPLFLIFFTFAIARSIRDILVVDHIGGLALMLFFLAMQTFFFGLIATIIARK